MSLLLFLGGLGLLVVGAEFLVSGSSRIAARFGIPPLVIGLTIVAFGTSAPELAVSIGAALSGKADIAVGNVVGSNIFNVLLILGLSSALAPLMVSKKLVRLEVPLMIGASLLALILGWNGRISRVEGGFLILMGLLYTAFQILEARREGGTPPDTSARDREPQRSPWRSVASIILGLALLVWGSRWLVDGAVSLARSLGVGELIIGLTVIAAGTSLPELATSIMATLRGERDIAVGNVVGSNLFNILWVLGAASVVSTSGVGISPEVLSFDLPFMIVTAVACLPIFFTGYIISRWEGLLFLAYYVAYTVCLVLAVNQAPSSLPLQVTMLGLVASLAFVTLGVLAARAVRK